MPPIVYCSYRQGSRVSSSILKLTLISKSLRRTTAQFGLSFSLSAMTATSDATSIRNDDDCHHKQTFYIPPINLQSMDTFTVGREVLSLSYVMGGIEKSCLRHNYSFPIALTARLNCKNRQHFPQRW